MMTERVERVETPKSVPVSNSKMKIEFLIHPLDHHPYKPEIKKKLHPQAKITKPRKRFSTSSTVTLERWFDLNAYPNTEQKKRMARNLGIETYQIHMWFQNKRARVKKLKEMNKEDGRK